MGVRAYAVPERAGKRPRRHRRSTPSTVWRELVLLFDTETSADPIQRLLFGSYRLCRWEEGAESHSPSLAVVEEGLFHGPDLRERDPQGYEILQDYVRRESSAVTTDDDSRVLELFSLREFLDEIFWKAAYHGRALITGFNLPFDLSRLASHWTPTRGRQDGNRFAGGFSFILWPKAAASAIAPEGNPNRPRLLIRHVNRGLAFMQFSTRATEFGNARVPADDIEWAEPRYPGQRPGQFRGHFADLQTLAFALTDRHHSLDSACKAFDVPPELRKGRAKRHGIVSPEYITYNRQDVVASQALLERVRQELELHGAPLAPWDIHSPASLAKSALRQMGITPPLERAKGVSPVALGRAASAYFGGRAEARTRKIVVPVVYTDVTSMYPTVNTLAQLWDLLIAKELHTREVTRSARAALKAVTLERCLSPGFWPRLRFFAEVAPEGDILPVRARYTPGRRSFTIGVNHLSADQTLWYSGFDLAASALLTGRVPRIRQAFTIEGDGELASLKPVTLRGRVTIDPREQDFFCTVIEERHRIKHLPDDEMSPSERKRVEKLLKVIANSGSYGVFAQFDPRSLGPGKQVKVRVHGRDPAFTCQTEHPEDPGEFCFPPLAAWITSAARLMLALIERLVTDGGGTYLFTDTDSMAIVASQEGGLVECPGGPLRLAEGRPAIRALAWPAVDDIISRLNSLKPYGATVRDELLKLEDENRQDGNRVQLYGYMISAKRYCLFLLDQQGRVVIRKPSEHVLGTYMSPDDPADEEVAEEDEDEPEDDPNVGWIADTWRDQVHRALGRPGRRLPTWMARPAMHREGFTSPASLRPFLDQAQPQSYADQLKPFNFALRAQIAPAGEALGIEPARSRLLAPFERDPRKWLYLDWRDEYSKNPTRITTGERLHPSMSAVQSMRNVVEEYGEHPEAKSLGPDGRPCSGDTFGVLSRRHVFPSWIQHIGKEANRLEDVERGEVQDWDEVLERFEPRGKGEWEVGILPTLKALGAERVAAASGLSPRQVYRIFKSGRRPPPQRLRTLSRVALTQLGLQAEREAART